MDKCRDCEWLPTCGGGCPLQSTEDSFCCPDLLEQPVKNIHLELEARENGALHPRAARSAASRRERPEKPSPVRTEFQRDRDRILHSKAFRRLKHKTQVFISPEGDHYRTRLTHTLELSQIARTIARALNLNEDLTEAIALGHDLGHTPFGHIGEAVLDKLCPGGFRHYEQSLRVVDKLENDGQGLNLTREVRDGILKHSKGQGEVIPSDRGRCRSPSRGRSCAWPTSSPTSTTTSTTPSAPASSPTATSPNRAASSWASKYAKRIDTIVIDVHQRNAEERPGDHRHLGAGLRRAAAAARFPFPATSISARSGWSRSRRSARSSWPSTPTSAATPAAYINPYPRGDTVAVRIIDFIAGMTDNYALNLFQKISFPDYPR